MKSKSDKKKVLAWIALLSDPDKHVKGVLAVDKDGNDVPIKSKRAVRFCAVGSAERSGAFFTEAYNLVRQRLDTFMVGMSWPNRGGIVATNDGPDGRRRVLRAVKQVAKELGYL